MNNEGLMDGLLHNRADVWTQDIVCLPSHYTSDRGGGGQTSLRARLP